VLKKYVLWATDARVTRGHQKGGFRVLSIAHSEPQARRLTREAVKSTGGKQGVIRVDAPFGRSENEYWKRNS